MSSLYHIFAHCAHGLGGAALMYKYGSRNFWCREYYVDTGGKNAKIIQEYIRGQLEEDLAVDQMTLKEYMDPFTGSRSK